MTRIANVIGGVGLGYAASVVLSDEKVRKALSFNDVTQSANPAEWRTVGRLEENGGGIIRRSEVYFHIVQRPEHGRTPGDDDYARPNQCTADDGAHSANLGAAEQLCFDPFSSRPVAGETERAGRDVGSDRLKKLTHRGFRCRLVLQTFSLLRVKHGHSTRCYAVPESRRQAPRQAQSMPPFLSTTFDS